MRYILSFCSALAVAASLAASSQAANVYTITENQSQLDLTASGSFLEQALTIAEQHAGAITRYNGTIAVDFPGGPQNGGSIQFPGGSAAAGVNPTSGGFFNTPLQFTPDVDGSAGTDAANYGINVSAAIGVEIPPIEIPVGEGSITLEDISLSSFDLNLAVRDLVLDVTSGPTGIGAGGAFDASATSLSIDSGYADLNGSLVFDAGNYLNALAVSVALNTLAGQVPDLNLVVSGPAFLASEVSLGLGARIDLASLGSASLPNLAATDGSVSYVNQATPSTLVLPVDIALPDLEDLGLPPEILDLQLGLNGQLVATGLITEIPEPSSLVLGLLATAGVALAAVRRRRAG